MSNSTNLTFPFLTLGQAQKHVTVNESLLRLDALVQLAVVSATTATEPGSPSDGQVYILPAGKTGTHWGAMANNALAYYRDGVWEEIIPREGFIAYVKSTDTILSFNGSSWAAISGSVNFSASDKILGRVSSGSGASEEVAFTDQAQALCDDASFSAMRTTLGVAGLADANAFTAAQSITIAAGNPLTLVSTASGAFGGGMEIYWNSSSPAAADLAFLFDFYANDSGANKTRYGLLSVGIADPIDGSEDGFFEFRTVIAGSFGIRASLGGGFYMVGATGGDKGTGTINATAVYDDNTLLTCGPLELMATDTVDLEKWDGLVPSIEHPAIYEDVFEARERDVIERVESLDEDGRVQVVQNTQRVSEQVLVGRRLVQEARTEVRRHDVMHAFAKMREEGFDPRDPANFVARMKQDGAVPGLMTEAEWRDRLARNDKPDMGTMQTRTFLALDNLAVAFASVVERLEALEQR